jgi:hypothetical protein
MTDIPAETLLGLRDALETAQAGLTDAIAALASLLPEPATSARAQPVPAGDPIRAQTARLPASVWQKRARVEAP